MFVFVVSKNLLSLFTCLQREKDQVKEVKSGFDCGITLENYTDIKVGDTILTFEMREVK